MRILAFSDIHNNVSAVRKLREREVNRYDALIVAGDIGSDAAQSIFDVLRTFDCPVLYVLGNWDHRLRHDQDFGSGCHHIHLAPFRVGSLVIVGESIDGIDPAWNSIRTETEAIKPVELAGARDAYLEHKRAQLSKIVAGEGYGRTIVVTHYKLTKTKNCLPYVPLFLFGHNHGFKDTTFLGQRFVNVSALDRKVMVSKRSLNRVKRGDYRMINDGSYVVIEHDTQGAFTVECRRFDPDLSEWKCYENEFYSWATEVDP